MTQTQLNNYKRPATQWQKIPSGWRVKIFIFKDNWSFCYAFQRVIFFIQRVNKHFLYKNTKSTLIWSLKIYFNDVNLLFHPNIFSSAKMIHHVPNFKMPKWFHFKNNSILNRYSIKYYSPCIVFRWIIFSLSFIFLIVKRNFFFKVTWFSKNMINTIFFNILDLINK
jgi:hypothetical protein